MLMIPHLLGQIKTVATAAEVDAMRSLSCARYYEKYPEKLAVLGGKLDTTSCQRPEVEAYFSSLMITIVVGAGLLNFQGMLIYGRLFRPALRRYFALLGILGNIVARVSVVLLPLYQYPYFAPGDVRSISAATMVYIYAGSVLFSGLTGSVDLVTLCFETMIVDNPDPQRRSQLFSMAQVSMLLGASIGPALGALSTTIFGDAANHCIGYKHCIKHMRSPNKHGPPNLLFNTAPYWLAIVISLFGMVWVLFFLDTKPRSERESQTPEQHSERAQTEGPTRREKYGWMGPFRMLLPFYSHHHYDFRISQFVFAESLNRLSIEGTVVLIYILGFVFHWTQNLLSIGLSASNTLNMLAITLVVPWATRLILRLQRKPHNIEDLSKKQISACMTASECQSRRRPRSASNRSLPPDMSPNTAMTVRLWRAQADLNVARVSFLTNLCSWLLMALGVTLEWQWLLLLGASTLAIGTGIEPMLRSAGCTFADRISELEEAEDAEATIPTRHSPPQAHAQAHAHSAGKTSGADSYLVIVSTMMLPLLLLGPILRNWVYSSTIDSFPGAFFIVVAGLQGLGLLDLILVRRPYTL